MLVGSPILWESLALGKQYHLGALLIEWTPQPTSDKKTQAAILVSFPAQNQLSHWLGKTFRSPNATKSCQLLVSHLLVIYTYIYIYIYTHTQSHRVYIFIHYNCFRHIYRGYPEAWHLLYQIDLETTSKIRKALENSHFQLTQRGPKVSSPWRIHFNFGTCGHLWLNEGLHHFPFEKKQLAWEAGKVWELKNGPSTETGSLPNHKRNSVKNFRKLHPPGLLCSSCCHSYSIAIAPT